VGGVCEGWVFEFVVVCFGQLWFRDLAEDVSGMQIHAYFNKIRMKKSCRGGEY
jgi:hypothetical protein